MFYTLSQKFAQGDVKEVVSVLNRVAEKLKGKIKFGIFSLDDLRNKQIASNYNSWPLPNIKFFPQKYKESEFLIDYDGQMNVEEIVAWIEQQIEEDAKNKMNILY